MEQHAIHYREVGLGVRPPRVAVLLGSAATWPECLSLVQTLTGIWGGASFAVIPTDGDSVSPVFRDLLHKHDPDWFMVFQETVRISEKLQADLLRRHAVLPRPLGNRITELSPDHLPYPMTAIYHAIGDKNPPQELVEVIVDSGELEQLLIYSTTGCLTGHQRTFLGEQVVISEIMPILREGAENVWKLCPDIWAAVSHPQRRQYPMSLSLVHLGAYVERSSNPDVEPTLEPVVVVCGATLEDFAYYWTLRSMRGTPQRSNTFWVPVFDRTTVEQHEGYQLLWHALAAGIGDAAMEVTDHSILVTSVSIAPEDLADVGRELFRAYPTLYDPSWRWIFGSTEIDTASARSEPPALPTKVTAPTHLATLLPYTCTFWERENTPDANAYRMQFLGGEGQAIVNTPVPSAVPFGFNSKTRWLVDCKVEGLLLPTRPELSSLVMRSDPLESHRVSRSGITYNAVRSFQSSGQATRSLLVRPWFLLPTDMEVFEALFRAEGFALTPSDKGRYESEFVRKLGGLNAIGEELRDAQSVDVLLDFVSDKPNRRGVHDEGVTVGDRRYLDLSVIGKLWGEARLAKRFVNRYLQAGLLQRGFLIKCPFCLAADWYRLSDLTDQVVCHRCSRQHVFDSEAGIYFRLDELVTQALRNHSYITLLALDWLRGQTRVSFLSATACNVESNDRSRVRSEIDFLAVLDSRLVIGEAKKGGKLDSGDKKQLKAYAGLCKRLDADMLMVATDARQWSSGSDSFLGDLSERLAKAGIELMCLTGQELGWPKAKFRENSSIRAEATS